MVPWGISYGGWLTGLTACCDARLTSVVLTVPGVHTNLSIAKLILRRKIREVMQGKREAYELLDQTSWNLTSSEPAVPKKNILLIEATHDLFAPKESMEELWQKWGQPEIWRLPQGYVGLALGVPALTGRVLRWLRPEAAAPVPRTVSGEMKMD